MCLGDEISFTDLSEINGASIVNWVWNLGDGTIDKGIPRYYIIDDVNPLYNYHNKLNEIDSYTMFQLN